MDASTETGQQSVQGTDEPILMRITRSGKMQNYVAHAVELLLENHTRPVTLHTLPFKADESNNDNGKGKGKGKSKGKKTATEENPTARDRPKLSTATTEVNRLISVVEIVKRAVVQAARKAAFQEDTEPGEIRTIQVYQYNEVGALEDLPEYTPPPTEEDRAEWITNTLRGRRGPRIKKTPYMKVTLCLSALPNLVEQGASFQPVDPPRMTKTQKTRAKKLAAKRKAKAAANAESNVPSLEDLMEWEGLAPASA